MMHEVGILSSLRSPVLEMHPAKQLLSVRALLPKYILLNTV